MVDWKVWPIVALLMAGVGYLIKRRVEGKREAEAADNAYKWAKLHREMNEGRATFNDIIKLKAVFMDKKRGLSEAPDEHVIQVEPNEAPEWMFFGYELSDWERERAKQGSDLFSQLELNEQAAKAASLIDDNLNTLCVDLGKHLVGSEREKFDTAMEKWREYRNAQATYAGFQYEGGSIAPMIYWGEYFSVTKSKLDSLNSDVQFRLRLNEKEQGVLDGLAKEWNETKPH